MRTNASQFEDPDNQLCAHLEGINQSGVAFSNDFYHNTGDIKLDLLCNNPESGGAMKQPISLRGGVSYVLLVNIDYLNKCEHG